MNKEKLEFIPVGRAKDLTGQKYGKLTVLGRAPDKYRGAYWWCECECENHTIVKVLGSHLLSGQTKSCGCYNKEIVSKIGKNAKKDITGQKFGYLTVLRDSGNRAHNRQVIWECQCECGNILQVRGDQLKSEHTTSCGCKKRSRGEVLIENILIKENILFEKEKLFSDLHFNNNHRSHPRFDFYIPSQNLAIEFDGIQHFEKSRGIFNKISLEERQKRDQIKNEYCKNKNIYLIRIPYMDIKKINKEYLMKKGVKFE